MTIYYAGCPCTQCAPDNFIPCRFASILECYNGKPTHIKYRWTKCGAFYKCRCHNGWDNNAMREELLQCSNLSQPLGDDIDWWELRAPWGTECFRHEVKDGKIAWAGISPQYITNEVRISCSNALRVIHAQSIEERNLIARLMSGGGR